MPLFKLNALKALICFAGILTAKNLCQIIYDRK